MMGFFIHPVFFCVLELFTGDEWRIPSKPISPFSILAGHCKQSHHGLETNGFQQSLAGGFLLFDFHRFFFETQKMSATFEDVKIVFFLLRYDGFRFKWHWHLPSIQHRYLQLVTCTSSPAIDTSPDPAIILPRQRWLWKVKATTNTSSPSLLPGPPEPFCKKAACSPSNLHLDFQNSRNWNHEESLKKAIQDLEIRYWFLISMLRIPEECPVHLLVKLYILNSNEET